MSAGYVVTVMRPCEHCNGEGGYERLAEEGTQVGRWAVATLEEARELAKNLADNLPVGMKAGPSYVEIDALGEDGGSVSLPDGSSITVEPVEGCECDNTHEAVGTVCRWCWARGRRRWDDPEVERIPANDAGEDS